MRHKCVMARDDPHFRLRIPDQLKKQIESAAAEHSRSINAEIIRRLENSLLNRGLSSLDEIAQAFEKRLIISGHKLSGDDRQKFVKAYLEAKEEEIRRVQSFIDLGNELCSKAIDRPEEG